MKRSGFKRFAFVAFVSLTLAFVTTVRASGTDVDCPANKKTAGGKQLCYANAIVVVPQSAYAQRDSPECASDTKQETAEWVKIAQVAATVPAARQYAGAVLAVAEYVRSACRNGCEGDLGRIAEAIQLHKSTSSCKVIAVMIPESADYQFAYIMARTIGDPDWHGCGSSNQTLGGACGIGYAASEQFTIRGVGSDPNRVKVITGVIKNWRDDAPIEARLTVVYVPGD